MYRALGVVLGKTHEITVVGGITKIKFLQSPGIEEAKAIIDDLAENYPYEKRLWDLSDIVFNWTLEEIKTISEYGKYKFSRPNKLAVYAVDNVSFGEMRQFEVYREEEGKALPRAFRDEQEAIDWLRS